MPSAKVTKWSAGTGWPWYLAAAAVGRGNLGEGFAGLIIGIHSLDDVVRETFAAVATFSKMFNGEASGFFRSHGLCPGEGRSDTVGGLKAEAFK